MGPADTARSAGHRGIPHTADLRVEAWAPTREECLAQAVHGVVEAFADLSHAQTVRTYEIDLSGQRDEDLLVALLDEVVYRLDVADEIPLDVELTPLPDGLRAVFRMADAPSLPVTGAAPKAVTLHGLAFAHGADGWSCTVTLDV
ncbi:MAG: archease [Streptomycetaceae bacterium]|nr:archease [Streptomycetaceae bacterium]